MPNDMNLMRISYVSTFRSKVKALSLAFISLIFYIEQESNYQDKETANAHEKKSNFYSFHRTNIFLPNQ